MNPTCATDKIDQALIAHPRLKSKGGILGFDLPETTGGDSGYLGIFQAQIAKRPVDGIGALSDVVFPASQLNFTIVHFNQTVVYQRRKLYVGGVSFQHTGRIDQQCISFANPYLTEMSIVKQSGINASAS